jgi:cytochrome c oxidase assembly protein subunit 15
MSDRLVASSVDRGSDNAWVCRLALLTCASTVVLIFVGGLVTNTGSALAVPDWPSTFGYNMFLYPWSRMVGGIFYEHSHRLIGSVVGLLTLTLALLLWFKERRKSVRRLGAVAVAAVIVQGVLGGLRVVLPSAGGGLAVIHGCLAQAFLALTVTLALLTSSEWNQEPQKIMAADSGALKRLCLLTTVFVYMQIVFGAMLTHMGGLLNAHLLFAALVAIHVFLLARRIMKHHPDQRGLMRPSTILLGLLVVQLVLGIGSYAARFTSLMAPYAPVLGLALPTTHRLTGALMLAACTVLTLRAYRLLVPQEGMTSRGFIVEQVRA